MSDSTTNFRERFYDLFGRCRFTSSMIYGETTFENVLYRVLTDKFMSNMYQGIKPEVNINVCPEDLKGRDKKHFNTIKRMIQSKVAMMTLLELKFQVAYTCSKYMILGCEYYLIGVEVSNDPTDTPAEKKWAYLRYFHI